MIGWLVVAVLTVTFAVILGLLIRDTFRPLTDTDRLCARVDGDLDAGAEFHRGPAGWRNG